jgi:hypothetical protein
MKQQIMAFKLEKGDLIAVPYSNYLHPAIFLGYGSSGNFQFYMINSYRANNTDALEERLKKGKKPYVDFINRYQENTIAKIYEQDLSPEVRENYDKIYNILEKYKQIPCKQTIYSLY